MIDRPKSPICKLLLNRRLKDFNVAKGQGSIHVKHPPLSNLNQSAEEPLLGVRIVAIALSC